MTDFIIKELTKYSSDTKFKGHIKFGVEKSNVVSMSVSTRFENPINTKMFVDIVGELKKLFDENVFFGSLEFDIDCGSVVQFNWVYSCNGLDLKEKIRKYNADL